MLTVVVMMDLRWVRQQDDLPDTRAIAGALD